MLRMITGENCRHRAPLLHNMHAERKRLFVDMLGWRLKVVGDEERDEWDTPDAEYLVLEGDEPCEHLASLRLLRTDRPHLLDTVFPALCNGPVPRGKTVREITRLCLPRRRRARDRIEARNLMARAIVDYALINHISSYTAVCYMGFFTELLTAGWEIRPLGLPQDVDGTLAVALEIQIDHTTPDAVEQCWPCPDDGPRIFTWDGELIEIVT